MEDAVSQMAAILRISAHTIRHMAQAYEPDQKTRALSAATATDEAAATLERCAEIARHRDTPFSLHGSDQPFRGH